MAQQLLLREWSSAGSSLPGHGLDETGDFLANGCDVPEGDYTATESEVEPAGAACVGPYTPWHTRSDSTGWPQYQFLYESNQGNCDGPDVCDSGYIIWDLDGPEFTKNDLDNGYIEIDVDIEAQWTSLVAGACPLSPPATGEGLDINGLVLYGSGAYGILTVENTVTGEEYDVTLGFNMPLSGCEYSMNYNPPETPGCHQSIGWGSHLSNAPMFQGKVQDSVLQAITNGFATPFDCDPLTLVRFKAWTPEIVWQKLPRHGGPGISRDMSTYEGVMFGYESPRIDIAAP